MVVYFAISGIIVTFAPNYLTQSGGNNHNPVAYRNMDRRIIGIGETVLDIIFRNDQPLKAVPGGSTFNALISIGRTGTPCVMATEVGDDHVADIVTDFLKANNVDTSYVFRHKGTQSHVSLAFLNEQNDAQYQFYKNHAALTMDNDMPEVHEGDIVLFGSYFAISPMLRTYVATFLKRAKAAGAILYYDINFRASHLADLPATMPHILENMQLASVVRGSAEDFQILFGCNDAAEVYKKHISPHCPVFIYTDGAHPIRLFTPTMCESFPAKPIETVSTIGAGDNFNAGFCYALYRSGITDPTALNVQQFAPLIAMGQRFSSAVCATLDNYIPEKLITEA